MEWNNDVGRNGNIMSVSYENYWEFVQRTAKGNSNEKRLD